MFWSESCVGLGIGITQTDWAGLRDVGWPSMNDGPHASVVENGHDESRRTRSPFSMARLLV
jgi:hypothetical protein